MVKIRWCPCDGGVAIIAVVTTREMSGMLSGGSDAIVTRPTAAEHLCMVHQVGWRKGHRVMAVLANIGGLHVRRVLAGRIGAVMAAGTVAADVDVIKVCGHPAIAGMTIVTGVAARNVGRVFARCDIAVVAGLTGTDDLSVVHHGGRRPKIHAMAVFADRSRCYVTWVFAGCIAAVMAA